VQAGADATPLSDIYELAAIAQACLARTDSVSDDLDWAIGTALAPDELLTSIQLPVVCAVRGFAAGLGFQLAQHTRFHLWGLAHSGLRIPMRGGHRMISPRSTERITVWVK
jgi:enoyl-CoA hydratase/carnithine racemase